MGWLGTWSKRTKITIDNTNIDSNLTHFPIPIFIGSSVGQSSQDLTKIFDEVGANSKKIAITKLDGETQLYAEIEKWEIASMISHWKMNDNEANTTVIDSFGSNDGTLLGGNNTEDISVAGKINNALNLQGGSDYINCSNDTSLNLTNSFTISLWWYQDNLVEKAVALSKGDVSATRSNYHLLSAYSSTDGRISLSWRADSAWQDHWSTGALSSGAWHHVVIVYNGTNLKYYFNGVLDSTVVPTTTPVTNSDDFIIAGMNNLTSQYFDGKIDDIRIYSNALSQPQVITLYNSGNGTEEIGILDNAILWVSKSDWEISSSVTTDFYLYYDNNQDDNTTYVADVGSRTEVWDSNFVGVWHLNQNPAGSSPQAIDSTSNNKDATSEGSMTSGDLVNDDKYQGWDLDGSDDDINLNFNTNYQSALSLEIFFKYRGIDSDGAELISKRSYYATSTSDFPIYMGINGTEFLTAGLDSGGDYTTDKILTDSSLALVANTKYYAGLLYTGNSTAKLFKDGVKVSEESLSFQINTNTRNWKVGEPAFYNGGGLNNLNLDGIIFEVRISNVDRGESWTKATSYSLHDNLLTFGNEEIYLSVSETLYLNDTNILNIPIEVINIIESIYLSESNEITTVSGETININETLYLGENEKFSLLQVFSEILNLSDSNSIVLDEDISYASQIISYNPLIILTGLNPVKLVYVDISTPTIPVTTVYEVTTITNAKDIILNDTSDYFYLGGADGIIVKISKSDLSNQTIIDTEDSDNFQKMASLDNFYRTFGSTDDANGEIIMIDESVINVINTDLRFIQQIDSIINTQLNTILAYKLNTDFRFIEIKSYAINTDLRFLKYSYSNVSYNSISYDDCQLKINDVDLCPLNDVDMKSIQITHTMDDESVATFILNRRHDKLDYDNQGNSSEITNQNSVKIYINSTLEFSGYISNLDVDSENETVTVTALMEQPSDIRQTVSIPLPSVNESLHPYHCLLNSTSIQNPVIDNSAVITSDSGLFWNGDEWVGNINKALEFASFSLAQTYIDNTLIYKENAQSYVTEDSNGNLIILSQNVYPTNKNQNPKYYKGIAVNLGTKIEQNIISSRWILDSSSLATKLEEGTFEPTQNITYFWLAKFENFLTGRKQTTLSYLGTSLGSLATDAYKVNGASYYTQKILEDIETDLGWYYIGSAPYKEVSVTNGIKITKNKWVDKNNGLYRVKEEGYNYEQFAKDIASIEYNKLKTINSQILPVTSANIDISLDAYYYYTLKLLTRINITNTTTSGIYKNLNGFPLSIKSISINFSDMKVSLNCSNQKSLTELQEADDTYPDENSDEYLFPEESAKIHSKFDPNKWGYIV